MIKEVQQPTAQTPTPLSFPLDKIYRILHTHAEAINRKLATSTSGKINLDFTRDEEVQLSLLMEPDYRSAAKTVVEQYFPEWRGRLQFAVLIPTDGLHASNSQAPKETGPEDPLLKQ